MKNKKELFLANIRNAARSLDGGDPETAVEHLDTAIALAPSLDARKTCEKAHEESSIGDPERAEYLLESLISDFAAPHKTRDCKTPDRKASKSEGGHTPGPWLNIAGSIGSDDFGVIAMMPTKPESEANARLIASSPEMLAALEQCLAPLQQEYNRAGHTGHKTEAARAFIAAKNAIAKAKGTK